MIDNQKEHQTPPQRQFLRLYVSTQKGIQFITCIDRMARGQDLEFEIAERYEEVVNPSLKSTDDCILKKYKVTNIKHHGYLLVVPKNMSIGHFLDDMAQITCEVLEIKKIEVKIEDPQKRTILPRVAKESTKATPVKKNKFQKDKKLNEQKKNEAKITEAKITESKPLETKQNEQHHKEVQNKQVIEVKPIIEDAKKQNMEAEVESSEEKVTDEPKKNEDTAPKIQTEKKKVLGEAKKPLIEQKQPVVQQKKTIVNKKTEKVKKEQEKQSQIISAQQESILNNSKKIIAPQKTQKVDEVTESSEDEDMAQKKLDNQIFLSQNVKKGDNNQKKKDQKPKQLIDYDKNLFDDLV